MTRRRRSDADFAAEIEAHIALEAERLREEGASEADALAAARRAFGSATRAREDFRESGRWRRLDELRRDVRYALRTLRKSPGFAIVAVATLALGIGANTAIFSIVNAVLLSPLPFPDPGRLVMVRAVQNGQVQDPSTADVVDYQRASHAFEELAPYDYWRKNVSGIGEGRPGASAEAEEMFVGLTPASYFEALRIRPVLGRLFRDEENVFGKHFVAIINTALWRERYGADPHVLGRTLRINGETYTIVGVIPDVIPRWMDTQAGMSAQIWTPMAPYANFFDETNRAGRGSFAGVFVLGRIKAGFSLAQAEADLNVVAAQLAARYPADRGVSVKLQPLAETRTGPLRPVLLLLSGAVGLILLIACSNVANLLLVRHSGRRRELALRAALGGRRGALVRQLAAESLILAAAGGAVGLVVAVVGSRLLLALRPAQLRQLGGAHLDARVLAFSAGLAVMTVLISGLVPAVAATKINLADALKESARAATAGVARQRLRRWLVVAETALSLMLMIGAGLLLRTVSRLQRQDLGFSPARLLRAHIYVPEARYPDSASLSRFVEAFRERTADLPGVVDATITTIYPPANRWDQVFLVPGRPQNPDALPTINFGVTDEHFLSTLGVPLLRGRNFASTDREGESPVALINQAAVRRFFPGEDPVGRRVHLGVPGFVPVPRSARISADVTIVGVMGDTRNKGLREPAEPQLVGLFRQLPSVNFGFKDIVVRTAREPLSIAGAMRRELRRLDPDVPLGEVATMEEIVSRQTSDTRFTTLLLGLFAGLGTILAMIGVYGVIAYAVAQRTQEIGVRVALGARGKEILWLALRPGLAMGAAGAAVGIVGAAAARRMLSAVLFGISPLDPATFGVAAGLLLAAVAAACAVPAWRATRVDPVEALRWE